MADHPHRSQDLAKECDTVKEKTTELEQLVDELEMGLDEEMEKNKG